MAAFAARRLLFALPSLLGITLVTFVLLRLIPGSVIDYQLGTSIGLSAEQVAILKERYGLDAPIWEQYAVWLSEVVRGDLGISIRTGTPVTELVLARFPVTFELAAWALAFALSVGLPMGTLAALRPGSRVDALVRVAGLLGLAMPSFWIGTLLILFFSTAVQWLPNASAYTSFTDDPWRNLQQNVLPALTLGVAVAAPVMRMTRAAVLDVSLLDHVVVARSKGLPPAVVNRRHVLRNAAIPIISVTGVIAGHLLTGAVVVEQVFNVPGVGRLLLTAILGRDYPVVEGTVLMIATVFVLTNLVADLAYGFADPRIRQG